MSVNLNLRHMEALVAIARTGNFTRASQALNVSQPSLTVQIHQLDRPAADAALYRRPFHGRKVTWRSEADRGCINVGRSCASP